MNNKKILITTQINVSFESLNTKSYKRLAGFDSRTWDFIFMEINLIINVEALYFIIKILLHIVSINIHTMFN